MDDPKEAPAIKPAHDTTAGLASDPHLKETTPHGEGLRHEPVSHDDPDQLRILSEQIAELRAWQEQIKTAVITVKRISATLTPSALDAIDHALFGLKLIRATVSVSALIEAAVLHLIEESAGNPRMLIEIIKKHVGDGTARRRSPNAKNT